MDMRMNGMISNLLKGLAGLVFAGMMMCGCARMEMDMPATTYVDPACKEAIKVQFELGHAEAMDSLGRIDTKSYLTRADIDTYISSVTLAIYESGGTQAYLGYLTSGFNAVDITLRSDRTYNVYAVANMGDKRTALASAISGGTLSSMTYTVDYSSMNSNGIPMAISLTGQTFTDGQNVSVYLQRLLAKINVTLSCDWAEAVITGATVKNVNPTVAPFGEIPASSTNPATLEDIHGTVAGTSSTMSAVFYVPENTQGTVGSVASSMQKTYTNADLSGVRNYATYLEVDVTTTGEYDGNIVYRSYLGSNKTTDFNIERNEVYNWTISYAKENLQTYDWKRDTDGLYIYRTRFIQDPLSGLASYAQFHAVVRGEKISARTGQVVATFSPTVSTVRVYESVDGDSQRTTGFAYWGYNGYFIIVFNQCPAGPVYLEADSTSGVMNFTTTNRLLCHLNGPIRLEFSQELYEINSQYYNSIIYWESFLPYKFIVYNNGNYNEVSSSQTESGTGWFTDCPDNYSGIASFCTPSDTYYFEDETTVDVYAAQVVVYANDYKINEPYILLTLNYSASYESTQVTGTCSLKLYNNSNYITVISAPRTTITAGESLQLSYLGSNYFHGIPQGHQDDYTHYGTTVWSITDSSSGSTDGITIGQGINGGLLQTSNSTSPTTLTISAQNTYLYLKQAQIQINVVSGGPVITYTPSRLVVTGDSSVSVGGTTGNYTATLHYDEYHDGVLYASDQTADVSTECTFSSSDTGIATMSGRAATGVAAGTAYISASYTGTYGTYSTDTADRATLTVTGGGGPVITYRMYDITFAANPINVGGSTTATARKQKFVDGVASGEFSSASATWNSNDISVASIAAATGAISGVNAGSTTFVATDTSCESGYRSITSSTFTVNAVVTPSIRFSPWNFSVAYDECVGYSNSLDVTASYENTGDESGFTSDYSNTDNCSAADFSYSNSGATVTFYWTNNNTTGSSRSVDITLYDPVTEVSDYIRITQAAYNEPKIVSYNYRNKSVTISADPDSFDAAAHNYTLTASATWEYQAVYDDSSLGSWTSDSGTPHISGSATGFSSVNTNAISVNCSASANTGGARYVIYTASFTFPDGSSDSDTARVDQSADAVSSTEYRNKSVTISADPDSFDADAHDYTLTASATWEYRTIYVSGNTSSWTADSGTPHISGSATGFTSVNTNATSVNCSASANTGAARHVIYTASYTFPDSSEGSDNCRVDQEAYVPAPTITYKVEVSPSSADIYVGGTQSFTSTLYSSTDGGSSWTAITPSSRSWSSSSTSVATINSSGVASGSSNGSTTITGYCTYGGNTYSDTATLYVHDNYSLSISGTTSAHYKSSIDLTVRLLKNGVEVSTSGISGSAQSGSFSVSKNSNTSFTLTTSHCCKYYDMSSYTVRFSCYTDSYTGTITEDESIEFLPYEYHSTIGLTYLKKPGNVIEYWAEARGDGLPPSTSVTATDSAGNTWTISAPNTASSSVDNPSGGNYYAPTALSITSLSTYNMFVVTPGGIYEIDWTGSVGSTQQQ